MEDQRLGALLGSSFLFRELPASERSAIAGKLGAERFAAGTEIVREGEAGDTCYVVASGEAAVVTRDLVGQEVTLQRFAPGASFGAVALTSGAPRTATVRALSDVETLTLSRAAFQEIAPSCPTLRERLAGYVDFLEVDRFLRRASPFARLPQETLRLMVPKLTAIRAAAGETVVREGDEGDRFYLVRAGRLEVTQGGRRRQELGPGDCFGEVALLAGGKRVATVRALADSELLALGKSDFDEVVGANAGVRGQLSELARMHGGQGLAVPDPITTFMPFLAAKRRDRYWRLLIAGIALFTLVSLIAARSGQELAIYGALVLGSFVVPVVYVTYLAEADILAARPLTLVLTFVLGAALGLPVAIWLEQTTGAAPGALDTALLIGVIEEFAKVLGVAWLLGRSSSRFQMDGVVYGAAAGMGFAAFETILYGTARLEEPGALLATLAVRSLLAPFGHGTWTAIVCATIWRYKGRGALRIDAAVLAAFALAVALHALWDWQPLPRFLGLVWYVALGAVGIWVLRTILHRATGEQLGAVLALNPELAESAADARSVACRRCGQTAPAGSHYCVRCGAALRA